MLRVRQKAHVEDGHHLLSASDLESCRRTDRRILRSAGGVRVVVSSLSSLGGSVGRN